MDLLRSWGVAVLVWLLGGVISVAVIVNTAPLSMLASLGGRVLVFYLPTFIVTVLMAALAALVHPSPARQRPARHAVAVLTVPAVSLLVGIVGGIGNPSASYSLAEAVAANTVAIVLGAVVGWQLVARLRGRRLGSSATHRYYPH